MPQYAWLELYRGKWYLVTGVKDEPVQAGRNWIDKEKAFAELSDEGWKITGPYPNGISIKLDLRKQFYGYSLIRTVH